MDDEAVEEVELGDQVVEGVELLDSVELEDKVVEESSLLEKEEVPGSTELDDPTVEEEEEASLLDSTILCSVELDGQIVEEE